MINFKFMHFKCKRKKNGALGGFDTVYLKGYTFPAIQWGAMDERDIFQVLKSSKPIQRAKVILERSDPELYGGLIIDGSEAERISKKEYQNDSGDKQTHYMEYLQYSPTVAFFLIFGMAALSEHMGW
jgi:hypothetical protein